MDGRGWAGQVSGIDGQKCTFIAAYKHRGYSFNVSLQELGLGDVAVLCLCVLPGETT